MFERFSQASRRVVVLAQQEARRLEHDYIGTEHELLGLLLAGDPAVEAAVGTALPVDRAREAIVEIIGRGTQGPRGHISFTPRAKKVLELALREALRLRSRTIRPGHILLALIREGDGVGAQVLAQAGVDFETARLRAIAALDATSEREPSGPTMASAPDTVIAQLRTMCADDAEAALDRAVEGGLDGVPTPWSLLRGIAAGEGAAASVLEGLDLAAVTPVPPEEPVGRSFLVVFQRSQGLAGAVGTAEPAPGPGSSLISSLHLLAVLLSPGEGSVTGELGALGADPGALRRQVLALL